MEAVLMGLLETAVESASLLTKVRAHPYLEFAHATLCILHLREDIHHTGGGVNFARAHPLVTWLSAMVTTFAGLILVSLMCGEPLAGVLSSLESLGLASLVWYLVFYSPGDIFLTLVDFFPVKVVLVLLKEIFRAKKIALGVAHSLHLWPGNYLIPVFIALFKANGSSFTLPLERALRGVPATGASEFLRPSLISKACIFGAILHVAEASDAISASAETVALVVTLVLAYLHVGSLFINVGDPFLPLENLVCSLTLGGAWEALKLAATTTAVEDKKAQ